MLGPTWRSDAQGSACTLTGTRSGASTLHEETPQPHTHTAHEATHDVEARDVLPLGLALCC